MILAWLIICRWWQCQLRHHTYIIRLLSFAFIVGTIIGPFLKLNHFYVFCLALGCGVVVYIFTHKTVRLLVLMVGFLLIGVWRYQIAMPQYDNPHLIQFYYEQKVTWQGIIVRVQDRIDQQKLLVDAEEVIAPSVHLNTVSGRVLVSTALWPRFNYGDVIQVECVLKKPEKWNDFDYVQYLAKDGVYTICNFAEIKKMASGQGNPITLRIYQFREYLQQRLFQTLTEPHVSIIDGMILGNAYGVPKETNTLFSMLGLTHIIAISGSHIVIMISLCMWLAFTCRLKRQQAFPIAVGFVVVYIILVGAPPSAVRAGIMGIIVLLAQQISRRHQPLHTLLLTAVLMLVVNPKLLLWDIGFQLSFAAVFGLLVIAPILERRWHSFPNFLDMRTVTTMTVAAQLATLPIIIFHFKQISPWSIMANLLILPIVPFMTIYALVHVLVAGVSVSMGSVIGWGSWLLVSYWLLIASALSKMPLVTIVFDGIWILISCLISLILLVYVGMCYRRQTTSRDIL